jgi:hypothetical protein
MQRRQAEVSGARVTGKTPSRNSRNISFSHIDPTLPQRLAQRQAPWQSQDQEESLRLLQRLRQTLKPWSDEQAQVGKDYESLQDELQRLSQHKGQQTNQRLVDVWDNGTSPYPYTSDPGPDRLPYRTIRLVTDQPHSIERLDVTPLDLSRYRQVFQETPAPARTLTLVTNEKEPAPQAPDLLIEEEVQLGHATANLTQQSLQNSGKDKTRVAISPKLALSLLDS